MKYLVSFRTTLLISRYLFRSLALLLWLTGALLTISYLLTVLHQKESVIREQLFSSYSQAQWRATHLAEALRGLKYVSESELNRLAEQDITLSGYRPGQGTDASSSPPTEKRAAASFSAGDRQQGADAQSCPHSSKEWNRSLRILSQYLTAWENQFASSFEISRFYLLDPQSDCLKTLSFGNRDSEPNIGLRALQKHTWVSDSQSDDQQRNPTYWISRGESDGTGSYFMSTPVYAENIQVAQLILQQSLRLDESVTPGAVPVSVMLTDRNRHIMMATRPEVASAVAARLPRNKQWFGYLQNYRYLILKKNLSPGPFSLVYVVASDVIFNQMKLMLLNALLLNSLSALFLISLALLFERRMFVPALSHAQRLEEHEQFNRKIVASAPVGICILRISDGSNILSNELAHNYLTLLTAEDRQRLGELIRGQQVNFMDILTASKTNLQMSFVHSRYRNEDVAICVLVDVSARVKMEQSLQEMAQSAEEASHAKSMFLATVSHELRTPLYGIIGNLDLMQTRELPDNIRMLVAGMSNSSNLLLKIINDILDISKIESEQLKITPVPFSPREMLSHIITNYLPLIVSKRLTLWCFVEPDVPAQMDGDALRLQQVIANLLSNSIKFTHTGAIILHLWYQEGYLFVQVRDTGVGICQRDVLQLFDPFFQVGSGIQRHFQGTGLGLAICEKLVNMMDGDISVNSEPDIGSEFILRLPVWQGKWAEPDPALAGQPVSLKFKNQYFAGYLKRLLSDRQVKFISAGEAMTTGSIVLTDSLLRPEDLITAAVWVVFDPLHNDKPVAISPNHWKTTPATAYQLPGLLSYLWHGQSEQQKSPPDITPPVYSNKHYLKILVVDDHPINRQLLSEQLTTLGYQVRAAKDGLDALDVINHDPVDMVLTDVNMPNLDGYELTRRLRETGHRLPIIGVTANALADRRQHCLKAGMDDCLSKPVTLQQLETVLIRYCTPKPKE